MNVAQLEALLDYIDSRIAEEIAGREEGSDGMRTSAVDERKAREQAYAKLRETVTE